MQSMTPERITSRDNGRWPQFRDQPQDVGEEVSRNRDLGHLEGDIASVIDDLGADLDQLFFEACQRPVFDRLGCRQRAQAKIIGERMKPKADSVEGGE
jgi:hypothetical protein